MFYEKGKIESIIEININKALRRLVSSFISISFHCSYKDCRLLLIYSVYNYQYSIYVRIEWLVR